MIKNRNDLISFQVVTVFQYNAIEWDLKKVN